MALPPGPSLDTRNATTCRQFIASLPLTSVGTAHQKLGALLAAMEQGPPPARDYLAVLESAREPLNFLQEAMGARYAAHALPAGDDEAAAFGATVGLWRLMANNYARVAQLGGGDPQIQQQLAVVCQRCLYYAGLSLVEYYRARRAVAPGLWMDFHGYFETAEDWGLAQQPVAEPLNVGGNTTTAMEVYGTVLLLDLASPYSRTPRELSWIGHWAKLMAPLTAINLPDDEAGGRGYGIDLMQDRGLLPVDQMRATPSARLFDTSRLAPRIQRLLAQLKEGQSPAGLGLGDDCPRPQATRLLLQLYRPWCLAAMPRRFARSRAQGALAMVYTPEAMFYQVTGREFTQPDRGRIYSRDEMDKIWTFRNQVDPLQPLNLRATQLGYTPDGWEIADESMTGFRAFRDPGRAKVDHSQLVALKPPGKSEFFLAQVSWLLQEADGRLQAGFQVLPGPAQGIAVRTTGHGPASSARFAPGFLLPAVPSLKEPLSLVVPAGWYDPQRTIDIHGDQDIKVQLGELLGRGPNFERCTFTVA